MIHWLGNYIEKSKDVTVGDVNIYKPVEKIIVKNKLDFLNAQDIMSLRKNKQYDRKLL